ncbi:hypothetical protein [Candidatus Legionella polyplacis]|uniref:Uncharacterized protein n=1 Tax=Candidatus Legionella polyplacis TaxID=2005262 RepID=A0ABZ2H0Z4_9GAMM
MMDFFGIAFFSIIAIEKLFFARAIADINPINPPPIIMISNFFFMYHLK